MKKLLTLLTALILLFGMAACTVTGNNSSEPPASSEPPTSSDLPASSVVTPSNLPFVPETEMGEFGRSAWAFDSCTNVVWENEELYYIMENDVFSLTKKIYNSDKGFLSDLLLFDGYLYFIEEVDGNSSLVKIKTDGSDKTVLCEKSGFIYNLFIYEGYLHYKHSASSYDTCHKIKLDGSEPEQKASNFFPLGNGWIYKPGKIDADFLHGPRQFICGDEVFEEDDVCPSWRYVFFKENFCYYDGDLNQFVFYNIRNTEKKTFVAVSDVLMRSPGWEFSFIGNWIFYINKNFELCKIDIEGNGYEVLTTEKVMQFEVCGEWILCLTTHDFVTNNGVSLVKYDGTENKIIQ